MWRVIRKGLVELCASRRAIGDGVSASAQSTIMSLFAGSIFRIAVSSSRFSRSFSAATRILAEYGDRAPNPASNRLFISLNFDTSEHDLRAACEKYGVVRDTRVVRDRETQRSRG